ncbi:DUF5615 family PIN-like protein [Adonisia turfae]|uniref:DUF5615 domain-containing protein n=1 Tax=Adonisia turfae CCMR0081 TaxID=2292702 RepID=A0A6M0RTY4_9CYAN|nr:DUF5615 family PIN-like protein [Adonisia turfae]NEZ59222.1 hypothetical protein [Adonisia turfae CCMR0081]
MARLYSDEGFPKKVSEKLKQLDHDVLTVQEAGQANQGIPDDQVLAYATDQNRAVLTINRADFIRLHRQSSEHAGIVVCTEDLNRERFANRVDAAISKEDTLAGKLIRVNRPDKD